MGVFIPFTDKETGERYERELEDRRAGGVEGPLQRDDRTSNKKKSVNCVEILNSRRADEVIMALRRMVVRLNGEHRCQAVYRVHSDQAPELSGEKTKRMLESLGKYKTATAGFDPDANGRA